MASTTQQTTCKCLRCGRRLTSAKSIATGYGPTCGAKIRKAAAGLDGIKPRQIDRAQELIEQGGIAPVRGRRIFRAVSNDGTRTYLTAPQACTCAAGLKGRHLCFHRIAAIILAAA